MNKKESKFNGRKITEARELHGLSATYVAGEVSISRQSLINYESGKQIPKPNVLNDLARVLKVKWNFFTLPSSPSIANPTFFRSLAATTSTARQIADRKLDFYEEVVGALQRHVTFPELDLPIFEIPTPEALTDDDVESYAIKCREYWGLGIEPIRDLTSFLELKGILIVSSEEETGAIDAYSRWGEKDNRPYVHLCTNKHSAVRSRFDLAHELAHLVLHRHIDKSDFSSRKYFRHFEDQANRFAGAFLLPAESFSRAVVKPTLEYFALLKKEWQVSIAAMLMRIRQLDFIDDLEYKQLWIQYTRNGWKRREPLDDKLKIEEPLLIKELIRQYVHSGLISIKDFFASIPYDNKYIAQQLDLEDVLLFASPENYAEALKSRISKIPIRRGNMIILGGEDNFE